MKHYKLSDLKVGMRVYVDELTDIEGIYMQGACAASRRRTRCKGKARGAAPARSRASLKRGRGG